MKLILLSVLTIFFLAGTQSRADANKSVVKVYSGLCSGSEVKFAGSGLLLERAGKIYVITSEHVLIHGNEPYCHHVYNKTFGSMSAKLISADWGEGLALLELDAHSVKGSIPDLSFANETSLSGNEPVITTGFPYLSKDLIVDHHGYILDTESHRHWIPMVSSTIELMDAHGEFGMSGAPVFASDEKSVIGILSHQYLKMIPGAQTQAEDFDSSVQTIQNHLFVIPAAHVSEWLDRQLLGKAQTLFIRDPKDQLNQTPAVYAAGFQFLQTLGISAIGGQGAGVGGQGAGVGGQGAGVGGQGAGVGGQNGEGNTPQFYVLEISLDNSAHTTDWYLPSRASWLAKVQKHLFAGEKVTIPYFISRDPENDSVSKTRFQSLAEFFSLLRDEQFTPVTIISGQNRVSTDTNLLRLQEDGQVIVMRSKALGLSMEDASTKVLLKRIGLLGELLASSDNWTSVCSEDLIGLGPNHMSWKVLFTDHYDDAVEILTRIDDAGDRLKQMKF